MEDFEDRDMEEMGDETIVSGEGSFQPRSRGVSSSTRALLIVVAAMVLIFIVVAAAFFLFRDQVSDLFAEQDVPTLVPTIQLVEVVVPTQETAGDGAETPQEDLVWDRVVAAGELSVGTSADYPPFEYYDANRQLAGLDIAIIHEIAARLGLDLTIHDIPFEGLQDALQANQIDLAISAISVTEDRLQNFDFSNLYYVGADALLAANDSPITTMATVEQIGSWRLGVQSGSFYDSWAQKELIGAGLMPPNNLHQYQRLDEALADLQTGLIDLVAMDLAPAEAAASRAGLKIVARNLNSQRLAMAMNKGTDELRRAVNQALFQMQGDGTLSHLIQEYIQVPVAQLQPLPTFTPLPDTQPPTAPQATSFAGCVDAVEFVADLGPGGGSFSGLSFGESFTTGWRMRNAGTCAWTGEYALMPVNSNVTGVDFGASPIPVGTLTQPGGTFDFFTTLTAPDTAGNIIEYWSMVNTHNNRLFGDQVWVSAQVLPPPTNTPLPTIPPVPTQTPPPYISFSASPTQIDQGDCSTLSWSTQNVQAVFVYPQGADWEDYGVVGTGSKSVCPSSTTTYEMRVILRNGSYTTRTAKVTVNITANPPTINSLTVTPGTINLGQCVTVEWSVSGDVTLVTILRDDTTIWPSAPVSGSTNDCPPEAGDIPYVVEATGPGGTSRLQEFIRVE